MSAEKTQSVNPNMIIDILGYQLNLMALSFVLLIAGILFLFWRIQRSEKLDFADMITKNGTTVSLTKVLQLVGGLTATWIMIKLTLTGGLTDAILAIYLAYVGGIEGYSKFVAAKYNYREFSVKQPDRSHLENVEVEDPSLRPPKD